MPAMSMEAILGWMIIAGFAYIIGEYTDVFAYVIMYPKKALKGVFGAANTERVLGAGGLVGGMYFGPAVWEIGAAAVGGLVGGSAGVIALEGLGFELTSGELAAVGVVAVLAWVFASYLSTEDDD